MNKETLDAIIAEFGKRIVGIKFDNGEMAYLNYTGNTSTTSDVTTQTIGDSDFMIINKVDGMGNKYQTYHNIANVISFVTSDEIDGYVDPLLLK